jgi:HEAT repeat protein
VLKALGNDKEWAGWFEQATAEGADGAATAGFLETRIQSRDAGTRARAAWMTAAVLGPDPIMLPLLQDADPEVAISAVRAAAPFLTAEAFARLRGEGAALDALQQRFGVLQNVALRLRHKDVRVRIEAALALAPSGRDETAYLLAQALKDKDWFVRFAAAKGLAALSAKAALPAARKHRDTNAWVQRVVARIIEKAPPAAGETP